MSLIAFIKVLAFTCDIMFSLMLVNGMKNYDQTGKLGAKAIVTILILSAIASIS